MLKIKCFQCLEQMVYAFKARKYVMYPLFNKNQVAWYFLSPELEATWHTVAIIIWVVLLSPYLCNCGISINHTVYILDSGWQDLVLLLFLNDRMPIKNGWTVFENILLSEFSYTLVQLFLSCYLRTCVWICRYVNVWEKTWDKMVHDTQS
jgi:hypothetical protein